MSKTKLSYSQKMEAKPSNITFKGKDLPDMRDWHVGDTYLVTVKIKMTRKQEGGYPYDYMEDDGSDEPADVKAKEMKKLTGDFDVVGVTNSKLVSESATTTPEQSKATIFNNARKQGKSVAAARAIAKM